MAGVCAARAGRGRANVPRRARGDQEKDHETWHFSVSQLRRREWWAAELGRPFAAWPKGLAGRENQAYDAALAALATGVLDRRGASRRHQVHRIETPEREDLGDAVCQLSQTDDARRLGVTEEMAQCWFDQARDY